jgi:hypothetical protein
MLSAMSGSLEITGSVAGLLDDDIVLRVRGAGLDAVLGWRGRYRDDDGRVWRSAASCSEELGARWVPAKEATGAIAALRSLRPLSIEVRVETPDGRVAVRTLTRRLAGEGVRTRRWRDGLAATLHVPAGGASCATVVVDATAGETPATVATLAAPLLASRGALVLVVGRSARGRVAGADALATALERLAALPAASQPVVLLAALDPFDARPDGGDPASVVVLPPGVGARDPQHAAVARVLAWDALLSRLGARPRERGAALA